jgi:hypothetical protein
MPNQRYLRPTAHHLYAKKLRSENLLSLPWFRVDQHDDVYPYPGGHPTPAQAPYAFEYRKPKFKIVLRCVYEYQASTGEVDWERCHFVIYGVLLMPTLALLRSVHGLPGLKIELPAAPYRDIPPHAMATPWFEMIKLI